MSYANLIMFGSVLPDYNSKKEDEGKSEEGVINADDPANRDKVRSIMFGD
jgi:hypothetical protein